MPLFEKKSLGVSAFSQNPINSVDITGAGVTSSLSGTTLTLTIPAGTGSPAGSTNQVQYALSGSTFGGAANVTVDNGDIQLNTNASPVTPASGKVKLFGRNLGGRMMTGMADPSGQTTTLQPFWPRIGISYWSNIGNSTTATLTFGTAAPTVVGTATARGVATTSLFGSTRRLGYVSAATAGSLAAAYASALQFWRGNGPGLGGWHYIARFGVSDAAVVSGARMFVGLIGSTAAPTNVEPTAQLNCIGVGQLSTGNNLNLIYNDGTGTATSFDLGVNFPANTLSTDLYELIMFCPSNQTSVVITVTNLRTGLQSTNTLTTDLPANNQLLAPTFWRCNNATALAVGIDIVSLYIETDY